MKRYYHLYKITSPSGRVYIGISSNIKVRIEVYKYITCIKQHLIYRSLNKYGWENHIFEILKEGYFTTKEINNLEINEIKKYKKLNLSLNISNGGEFRNHLSGKNSASAKKIYQFNLHKDLINVFDTVKEASKELNLFRSSIPRIIKRGGYCKYGYYISYEENIENKKIINGLKIIEQRDDNFIIINSFISPIQLETFTKFKYKTVYAAIKYKRKSYGFYWTYKN